MTHVEFNRKFFGRRDILDLLKRRVLDLKEGYRQNVALLGNPFVGKTMVMHHMVYQYDDEDLIMIYFDLEHKDASYLLHKFIGGLLYQYAKNQKIPLHEDIALLMESVKKFIPLTVEVMVKLQKDFENKKLNDCFLGLLALPEVFTNETGKFCVLMIDEFQYLEELFEGNVFQELGKKIMTQKRCLYVLASSQPIIAQKILSEKLSLLFGNFEVINIDTFDLSTSQQFVDYNLRENKIGAQLRNFLTDFAGGHPLYLQLICQEMVNISAIHKQNEIYMPILTEAVENTIFDRWGVLSRHFELLINELCSGKVNHHTAAVLMSLANGKNKMDDIVKDTSVNKTQVKQKMSKLLAAGMLLKNGSIYFLKDKLFRYWIKYVYQKRIKDVEFSVDKQRKQFKEELNRLIENFKLTSRQDLPTRMADLLHSFDNESLDINGRHYKLPIFRDLSSIKIKDDAGLSLDVIQAQGEEALWYIVLKQDAFCENDVNTILKEFKKSEQKPERCVIISLTQLDEITRLKAMQERFWIWTDLEVNALLNYFNKPYILK